MKRTNETYWRLLPVLAALCTAVAFGIPAHADEPGCKSDACTYYDGQGHPWPGKCGAWDQTCGCFQNVGGGGQQQDACKSDIPD